jgi:hypothetical protein
MIQRGKGRHCSHHLIANALRSAKAINCRRTKKNVLAMNERGIEKIGDHREKVSVTGIVIDGGGIVTEVAQAVVGGTTGIMTEIMIVTRGSWTTEVMIGLMNGMNSSVRDSMNLLQEVVMVEAICTLVDHRHHTITITIHTGKDRREEVAVDHHLMTSPSVLLRNVFRLHFTVNLEIARGCT